MHPYVHSSTKSKTWEQPKCPLTDEWIKKMWCLSNEILLSHKKNKILPFAAIWIQLEIQFSD